MHANRRANLLRTLLLAPLGIMGVIPGSIPHGSAQTSETKGSQVIEKRLRQLEDREEIRQLLVDYGRTLDRRDFSGFSKLFAENAEYVAGGDMGVTRGAAAIAKLLEEVFRKNPSGVRSPNFHLFGNEIIQVDGDGAVATSKGIFVIPNEAGKPEMVMLATYDDILVREKGQWKFKKRAVHGDIPAPPASK